MRLSMWKAGLLAASCAGLVAQQPPSSQEEPIRTLHVYTDLVQVPTLVLGRNREPLKTLIPEKNFSVSIDNGRWFQVTHVRQEGNDPISLTILLDPSGAAANLMPAISDAIAALSPSSLSSKDRVSIYAMDCGLTRSSNDMPIESEAALKLGVDLALRPATIRHQDEHATSCRQSVHLWDAMGYAARELYKLPGRRVMLVVTDGRDRGSTRLWTEVRAFTQAAGIAVFSLTNTTVTEAWSRSSWWHQTEPNALQVICELSGGMVMPTSPDSIRMALKQLIATLRQRYIVEFPRPSNSTTGEHDMRIKIARNGDDFIRPSGISVPIRDPALLADPTTVPTDTSRAPEQGKRRILNPK